MAICCHKILLFTITYILLCILISRSTQSVNNAVGDDAIFSAEKLPTNDNKEPNILLELKAVLNEVKNIIYPNVPTAKDNAEPTIKNDETLPTQTVNGSALVKDILLIGETNKTVNVIHKNKRTIYNWFTIANNGWTNSKEEMKLKDEHKQNFIKDGVNSDSSLIEKIPKEDARTKSIKREVSNSENTKNQVINPNRKTKKILSSKKVLTSDISHQVQKRVLLKTENLVDINTDSNNTGELNNPSLSTDNNDATEVNSSYMPDTPIVLDPVPIGADGIDDVSKTSDSGKIETYSQFAERLSAEKKNGGTEVNIPAVVKISPKVKTKNYASQDCGAKLLSANPGAEFPSHVINRNKDEYMLNKCNLESYFVIIELCESIRTQKFDVANFELFSNVPKSIRLYGSHRYPVRDWSLIGEFQGEEGSRDVQSFVTHTDKFIKYVKLEVVSYFGTEFYCPLSLFRIYGLSEFEAIDHLEDDVDDFEEEVVVPTTEAPKVSGWDLKSLVGNVLNIIKRGSMPYREHGDEQANMNSFTNDCRSLDSNFAIKSDHCPSQEYLNYILACYHDEYLKLLQQETIATSVKNRIFCNLLAHSICGMPIVTDEVIYGTICKSSYPCVMLTPKHMFALCYMTYPLVTQNISNYQLGGLPYISKEIPVNNDSIEYKSTQMSNDSEIKQSVESTQVTDTSANKSDQNKQVNIEARNIEDVKGEQSVETVSNTSVSEENAIRHNVNEDQLKNGSQNISDVANDPGIQTETKVSHSNANKESIVVRLSHKIKVLEENMSISSQYLEELSQTYKRQMEEMKKQFNITITALNKSSQIAFDRDVFHHEQIQSLQERLNSMNHTVEMLIDWNEHVFQRIFLIHCFLIFIEIMIFCAMYKRYDRILQVKISRSIFCGECRKVVENGKISSDDSPQLPTIIHKSDSDDILSSANFDGSKELVRPDENSFSVGAPDSNLNIEKNDVIQKGTNIQNISGIPTTTSDQNFELLNTVKQVIPFRVEQRPGYEFNYTNSDFNSPVITDYYTANAQPNVPQSTIQPIPSFYSHSGIDAFNYQDYQLYMQWRYHHQTLQSMTLATKFNTAVMSEPDSGLRSENVRSELGNTRLANQDLDTRMETNDHKSRMATQAINVRIETPSSKLDSNKLDKRLGANTTDRLINDDHILETSRRDSVLPTNGLHPVFRTNPDNKLAIQDLDSRLSTRANLEIKVSNKELNTKQQEFSIATLDNAELNGRSREHDFGCKKQETSKRNKKRKNRSPK